MKSELLYVNLADNTALFPNSISSEGFLFIPDEGDTLIHEGWGFIIGMREYQYEDGVTRITIYCSRERKKRK